MDNIAWHEQCELRDDVRQDTLPLAEFAADLNAVRTEEAPDVYRLPHQFFDRTYPTDNLKRLVRDVLHRLAGSAGTPVIRVQVAYGGGKTHALIALLHLAVGGEALEAHPTVREFIRFTSLNRLPRARVALLPFDKFDVLEGLSVVGPDGRLTTVKTPWGALAYQLAGDYGLEKVSIHEERYIPPAEPVLVELLRAPQASKLSTLILMDETLWYMRNAVNVDPNRLGDLRDFFQVLTQAIDKVDRAALVASIISHDMVSDDLISIQCLNALEKVFHRMEETKEPVSGEDIPELLRRRLFQPLDNQGKRRSIVERLTEAMQRLPLRASQRDQSAKEQLLESYPFHPDLLEVFYQKWTRLSNFQRTRGVLRMFAIALRDAEGTDASAFVGPGVLLGGGSELSEAVRELIETCDEGNKWTPILHGELGRARRIQEDRPLLRKHREIEQAVLATFLHSQPSGQKADVTDLLALLAHAEIDAVSVEDGLAKWREISWFLKEDYTNWSLDIESNLTKMHVDAMRRLNADDINDDLLRRIREAKLGQTNDDITVHPLPDSPADIPDNADLHFVIAPPEYTAVPGERVSVSLKAFFNRTYRNHIIVLASDTSRLSGLTTQIRRILGWQGVEREDELNRLNDPQRAQLLQRKQNDEHSISDSVKSTYCVLIALDEDGDIAARQLPTGTEPAFERVKTFFEGEGRLLTTTLDPDLLKPAGYLELWRNDETSKPVQGLYGMFASLPRLPRLLSRQVFFDTLRRGVSEGKIVLRDVRSDSSQRTFWRESLSDEDLSKNGLEIVPVENAELHKLRPELLCPDELPELWPSDGPRITVSAILQYFNGENIPKLASDEVLFGAVKTAIEVGVVMGRSRGADYFRGDVADSIIDGDLELLPPPAPIHGSELTPQTLPDAWEEDTSTVGKIWTAIAKQRGAKPPWVLIKGAVNQGLSVRLFEITTDNPAWPCDDVDQAYRVGLRVSEEPIRLNPREIVAAMQDPPDSSGYITLGWVKKTLESEKGVAIPDDVFRAAVSQAQEDRLIIMEDWSTGDFYQIPVRLPAWIGHAQSRLTETEIQDFAETISDLSEIAPELEFEFQITITAEGETPSQEVLNRINEAFRQVTNKLKFDVDSNSES